MGAADFVDAMLRKNHNGSRNLRVAAAAIAAILIPVIGAAAQQTTLQLDPAKTTVTFTLDAALHNVHGNFRVKPATLEFDPSSGQVSGEILVDARSGLSGNGMRDRKMHNEVLESANYPEISFRPDRITGAVANTGKSSVMVHGMFRIHGTDREITVPAQVEMAPDRWTATVHFTVPYAKWGMKNPSTLFLRVSDSVEIDLAAAGSIVKHAASASQ
jgi:polyisoprenoid-binding protein YceI